MIIKRARPEEINSEQTAVQKALRAVEYYRANRVMILEVYGVLLLGVAAFLFCSVGAARLAWTLFS